MLAFISKAIYWARSAAETLSIHFIPCLASFFAGTICSLLYAPIRIIWTDDAKQDPSPKVEAAKFIEQCVSISTVRLKIIKDIIELTARAYPMGLNGQTTAGDSNSTDFKSDPVLGDIDLQSKTILSEVAAQVEQVLSLSDSFEPPHLAVVIVGDRKDSLTYIGMKIEACKKVKIKSSTFRLAADSTTGELLKQIDKLNYADDIDGILVQLPLPESIDEKLVVRSIDYRKDVDGLHPYNMECLTESRNPGRASFLTKESNFIRAEKINSIGIKYPKPECERLLHRVNQFLDPNYFDYFTPCTAGGLIELLVRSQVPIAGSQVTVVGRSSLVVLPLLLLLQKLDATVTMCHLKTRNLQFHCLNADILIVAIECPNLITKDWVKESAIVINAGIIDDSSCKNGYRLCGDVKLDSIRHSYARHITPTLGGGGPMSISILMRNVEKSWLRRLIQKLSCIDNYSSNK